MDSEFFTHTKDGAATSMLEGADFTDISLLHTSKNGFTEVYKAKRYGKWHVLKCLTKDARDTQHFQQLLQKEFEISYQLNHQGVVQTIGMESLSPALPHREGDRNLPVLAIVQEYIDGETWNEFFAKVENRTKETVIRVLCELCDAIDFIHQHQIIHRDIKPENILITRDGHHPKLIDFGLADRDVYADLKEPAGTKGYASPEQQTNKILDNRSDIYSLGIIINGIVAESKGAGRLSRIAHRCLANDPNRRYRSAIEVKMAIMKKTPWWSIVAAVFTMVVISAGALIYSNQSSRISMLNELATLQQEQIAVMDSTIKSQEKSLYMQATKNKTLNEKIALKQERDSIVSVIMEEMQKNEKELYLSALSKYPLKGTDMQILENTANITREFTTFSSFKLVPYAEKVIKSHGIKPSDTDYQTILSNTITTWKNASAPHLKHINWDVISPITKRMNAKSSQNTSF